MKKYVLIAAARKISLTFAATVAVLGVTFWSSSVNALTSHFSFNNAPNFDLVEGTISGLLNNNSLSAATSVQVTSNPEGFGIGEYIGSPNTNLFSVSGGMVQFANFESLGFQNLAGDLANGTDGVTCCSLRLSVINGPGLSNNPNNAGFGSLNLVFTPVSEILLPAALPLFATGLGALGLLAWRRKKKAQAKAP